MTIYNLAERKREREAKREKEGNDKCIIVLRHFLRINLGFSARIWEEVSTGHSAINEFGRDITCSGCFPNGSAVKNLPAMQETQDLWVWSLGREDPQRRKWETTPVFSPGKSLGQRSLARYNPWGHKELDMTERLSPDLSIQEMEKHCIAECECNLTGDSPEIDSLWSITSLGALFTLRWTSIA